MKAKNKVVYVPPVYEDVQHEVTSVDDKNNPLRTSFHTDVSLLQRIDTMRADAQTLREIKESLQRMIDNSNFRSQFEETFGSLTDDELINSCPSRYVHSGYRDWETDRKSTRLNSSHRSLSRMPSSA